ncbi:FadR family transcriptional regulator [Corticibacter populi]|uniref:FadR family transcriptional regulator n=1 Tax=Corticibacter populi TaxID=1550736 RepID=A0A3M6R1P3_9BURK|nr:FadR/GntR family transcriptional regulator [Corticibacter populi]RMX08839.1 FadR family transcriptional regulator [Corticibacter populi]
MKMPSTELPEARTAATPFTSSLRGKAGRNGRSLANLLSEEFAHKIRQGLLSEGDQLPTESELVRSYDVSRTVVREAISKLQAAGLVETRHGIGTFVQPTHKNASLTLNAREFSESVDVLAMLELRISLETGAAALAAQRRSTENLQTLREALTAFERNAVSGDDTIAHDMAFHLGIAQASGNPYFRDILAHFGTLLIPRTRIPSIQASEHEPDYLRRVNREHEEIYNAIKRQDADSARAAMRIHLTNSRERLRLAQQLSTPPTNG